MDLFDSARAAPRDSTDEAVAVREENIPWGYGEHPALGKDRNLMSSTLHAVCNHMDHAVRLLRRTRAVQCRAAASATSPHMPLHAISSIISRNKLKLRRLPGRSCGAVA